MAGTDGQAAAGRQRLQLNLSQLRHDQSLSHAQQTIAADAPAVHLPLEAKHGVAFWPAHIWSKFNAFDLAEKAKAHFKAMAPQVCLARPCPAVTCPALPGPCPLLMVANPVLCSVVLYCTESYRAVLCGAMVCWVVLCCAVLRHAVLCCAVLCLWCLMTE